MCSAASCHGHPRSTNCSAIALAERLSERLIGSIRREMLDHVIVFGEGHLRQLLRSYMTYYNEARTHLSLNKDAGSAQSPKHGTDFRSTSSRWSASPVCSDLIYGRHSDIIEAGNTSWRP